MGGLPLTGKWRMSPEWRSSSSCKWRRIVTARIRTWAKSLQDRCQRPRYLLQFPRPESLRRHLRSRQLGTGKQLSSWCSRRPEPEPPPSDSDAYLRVRMPQEIRMSGELLTEALRVTAHGEISPWSWGIVGERAAREILPGEFATWVAYL